MYADAFLLQMVYKFLIHESDAAVHDTNMMWVHLQADTQVFRGQEILPTLERNQHLVNPYTSMIQWFWALLTHCKCGALRYHEHCCQNRLLPAMVRGLFHHLATSVWCQLRYSVNDKLEYWWLFRVGQILISSFTHGEYEKERTCHLIPLGCDSILQSWELSWLPCRPDVSLLHWHALYPWKESGRCNHLYKNTGLDCTATWRRRAVLRF